MALTWFKKLFVSAEEEADGMSSMPGTSSMSVNETPHRKRPGVFSPIETPRGLYLKSKGSRKGSQLGKAIIKSEDFDFDAGSSQVEESSELMDPIVQYSESADEEEEEEQPCTSNSTSTPRRSRPSKKIDPRRTSMGGGRDVSAGSDDSDATAEPSPKRKVFYDVADVHSSRPAERFRTDILHRIRSADSEYTPIGGYSSSSHPASLRLTDRWREEWSHGVQVLLHPDSIPHFETAPSDIPTHSRGPWRLPRGKYLLSRSAPYQSEETHVVHAPPPLRIYQGDRLDELWLERLNREHSVNLLPVLDLATMMNLMNEYEIECFQNIHRIVLTSLASPSGTLNSADGVDEDAPCDICKVKEDDERGMIFCDGCNICVHLSCYSLDEVPEGHWECDMCVAVGFARHDRLKCALCPNVGGVMKELETGGKWIHLACAMWMPEIRFTRNKAGREVVSGLESIHDERWHLKCAICDLRTGAVIQCEHKSCATAFHVTCAQRCGDCDVYNERDDEEVEHFFAFCKRHTLQRKRERGDAVEQSEDETDERSEMLRGLERAFFLHVKFEDVAKRLGASMLHASDVYEYWKQKRSEIGGRPLIACPQMEIEVDTETPILTLASVDAGEGQVMLRASDDVQHQLTPFQLKCWRFQKHVFQTADRGRLGCDMIMKRERKKKEILETNRELFSRLVEMDAQPGIPISSRVVGQMIEWLHADMTQLEIAESDKLADEMIHGKREKGAGGVKRKAEPAPAVTPAVPTVRPAHSPTKENGETTRGGSPHKHNRNGRRTNSSASPTIAPSGRSTTAKSARRLMKPQNPPDEAPPPLPSLPSSPQSPSKLRERRDVKYF